VACIEARGLRKTFGQTIALDSIDLRVEEGRILGLIGPNGAGKSTALGAILGLIPYQGDLTVLGRNPWTQRDQLMRDVCFIADVAVLPRWMRVSQALDYVAGVHPRFDRTRAEAFLDRTSIKRRSRVRELSKGMLNDYFDHSRTIIVTTHQVEEIEHILTDVMFIDRGRIVLSRSMEDFEARYVELSVKPDQLAAARALGPIHERQLFGRTILLFDSRDRDQLAALGEVRTPGIADLFVAVMGQSDRAQGAAR
jgi:ABC-2 type transport system ATP-binding protein